MFQLNTRGYVPCYMDAKGWVVLDEHWKSVATTWGLQASTPVEAHPNCPRICVHHRTLLGVGYTMKKGVLSRKPDKAILVLKCVVCEQSDTKLSFATAEMQMAINEDHSTAEGIQGTKKNEPHACLYFDRPPIFVFILRDRDLCSVSENMEGEVWSKCTTKDTEEEPEPSAREAAEGRCCNRARRS